MKKKYILLIAALTMILAVVVVYYVFPGIAFKLLLKAERSSAGLKQYNIEVEGLHIGYLEGGKGDVVLLVHGFGANKDNWTRISKHLTSHFRVIALDLPGFGESSRQPDLNYTIVAQADRLHAFVRTLEIQSFHLGGSSMGGNIAGVYAAQHPENVISLWLVAPGGVTSADPSEMERELNAGRPNPLVVESVEDYKRLIDFIFAKKPFIPGPMLNQLAKDAIRNRALNQNIFKQINAASNTIGLESTLNGSVVPTLIVWGANDRVLHFSGAKILESVMPKAQVVIMEGVGHLPMIEKPRETAEIYISFLRQKK
jgi:abhydrolase domain-containing protein 6